jgi:hypothetical protein
MFFRRAFLHHAVRGRELLKAADAAGKVSTMKELFDELMEKSNQAYAKADEHERLVRQFRDEANELKKRAIELNAPFKRGDVIEFERSAKWKTAAKRYTVQITSLHAYGGNTIEIKGNIVTKKGDISSKTTYAFLGSKDGNDKLIRVVTASALAQPERGEKG